MPHRCCEDIKAFYMRLNEDNRTVAAMDVLAPQIGEASSLLPTVKRCVGHRGLPARREAKM